MRDGPVLDGDIVAATRGGAALEVAALGLGSVCPAGPVPPENSASPVLLLMHVSAMI